MRIIFCNRYVPPDLSATSQLLSDLAAHLAAQGVQVILLGSRQRYDDASADLPVSEVIDGYTVHRVGSSSRGRDALAGRALAYLDYLRDVKRALAQLLQPGDLVVAMTDPPLLGAAIDGVVARKGARCVQWLQDLFPEVAEGVFGRGLRLPAAPLHWQRNRSLRRSERVVVISQDMAARIAALGVPRERITVIENWTDDVAIRPLPREANPLRDAWGLQGKFVVGYSGNLGRAHDWRTMLEVATRLRDREDIRFVLIGGGRGLRDFSEAAQARGLANVQLQPYQPRGALAHSLALPDLHWLSLRPALEGCIFPSKWYGILAAGRPSLFIGDPEGEIARRLREAGCGFAVAPGRVDAAQGFIERLASDPGEAAAMGERARAHLANGLHRDSALNRWSSLVGDLRVAASSKHD
ncbi:MAG: glycosyltransferase family 4 protein [Thermomonas sp.]|uniref:glycosyltransferase family 4 protein n=1 Tax=Thermomonas sp. TaxID=1971895 RepID=UPI001E0DF14B|nr:glycosyltransferase family 4 protein [Thermomonas sp.]MBZ0087669.1 glycosyltransferase family 4 protein [Thermomonas sp.]